MSPQTRRSSPLESFHRRIVMGWLLALAIVGSVAQPGHADDAAPTTADTELQVTITKIGSGKEVVMTRGAKEWFMRVDVTPENSVVVRQEKDGSRYLLDDSEMHDRAMTSVEVDAAIADFVNSVKTRQRTK